jgi:FtsZ-binding cell division protein ZapB
MTLIERLFQVSEQRDNEANRLCREAADAIQALQLEERKMVEKTGYLSVEVLVENYLKICAEKEALQAENERLIQEQAAWRSFTEMANNTVSKAEAERDALAAKLATLEADAERLDWLEKRKHKEDRDGGYSSFYSVHLPAMVMGPWQRAHGGEFDHKTLRSAIDAAKGGQQ